MLSSASRQSAEHLRHCLRWATPFALDAAASWRANGRIAGSSHFSHAAPVPPAPPLPPRDTIFALSSGAGRSAVAVIRISGSKSDGALRQLLASATALPPPRQASLVSLHAPEGGLLDKALVLRMPGPRSFTGEDCCELHLHGSPAVVRAVMGTLSTLQLRPAEPGEFTRRAFDAGKLDLTQVEGLADLLAAETESQRRQALLHSTGAVRRQHEQWRQTLLTCLARLEAVIDFGEDEGIADDVAAGVLPLVLALQREVEGHLAAAIGGDLVRSGVRIVIVGPPNAGKSSLLNLLAGHEAAIVSPFAGTTRDPVSVQLELGGVKVILTDSAGLRQTDCPIEAEGVRRAVAAAQRAHLVLHVADVAASSNDSDGSSSGDDNSAFATAGRAAWDPESGADSEGSVLTLAPDAVHMRVLNKADLLLPAQATAAAGVDLAAAAIPGTAGVPAVLERQEQQPAAGDRPPPSQVKGQGRQAQQHRQQQPGQQAGEQDPGRQLPHQGQSQQVEGVHLVSCRTGEGIDQLVAALQQQVLALVGQSGGDAGFSGALVARARHRHHLEEAVAAMRRYEAAAGQIELACEELRAAARSLGRVVGAIDTEEVLSSLFSEFCIGK